MPWSRAAADNGKFRSRAELEQVYDFVLANPEIGLLPLGFEVFSAFSTVGLSLGITSLLSPVGKLILIGCMFIGRVGAFTLLISLFKQVPYAPYRYPKETVSVL